VKLWQALGRDSFETLLAEEVGGDTLVVTLNRPHVANAMTTVTGHELIAVFGALEQDPQLYRSAILTGAGSKAFCSGADLKQRDGMTDDDFSRQHHVFERMIRAITDCPIPLICAANGHAVAGGLELLLACDFAYAAEGALFGFTEVSRGIMPGGGGTQQLPRAVGPRRAKELIFRGSRFTASEALAWGVINAIHPASEVLAAALACARDINANAPLSILQAKKAVNLGLAGDLRTGLFVEIEAYNRLIPTADRLEGIEAYNQKRKPVFKGR
jgi:enoyl-CoA hydratase/carnithine racemase